MASQWSRWIERLRNFSTRVMDPVKLKPKAIDTGADSPPTVLPLSNPIYGMVPGSAGSTSSLSIMATVINADSEKDLNAIRKLKEMLTDDHYKFARDRMGQLERFVRISKTIHARKIREVLVCLREDMAYLDRYFQEHTSQINSDHLHEKLSDFAATYAQVMARSSDNYHQRIEAYRNRRELDKVSEIQLEKVVEHFTPRSLKEEIKKILEKMRDKFPLDVMVIHEYETRVERCKPEEMPALVKVYGYLFAEQEGGFQHQASGVINQCVTLHREYRVQGKERRQNHVNSIVGLLENVYRSFEQKDDEGNKLLNEFVHVIAQCNDKENSAAIEKVFDRVQSEMRSVANQETHGEYTYERFKQFIQVETKMLSEVLELDSLAKLDNTVRPRRGG